MKKTVSLFALFLVAFSPIKAQQFDYSFSESFTVDSPSYLSISSFDSNVEVIAHDKSTIEVHYRIKRGNQILNLTKNELEEVISGQSELGISTSSSHLSIKMTSLVKNYINFDDKIVIDFKVYAPKATRSKIFTNDGDISLMGLDLDQTCITNDGDIRLTDLLGDVVAQTNDADIILKNVTGKVDGKTNDGSIIDLSKEGK